MGNPASGPVIPLYFRRYAEQERLFTSVPDENTQLIITIPARNEPHLLNTINSLRACKIPPCHTEVLILDNHPENDPPEKPFDLPDNLDLPHLTFHAAHRGLAARKAGVGLARKILMDEAAWRFHKLGTTGGLIVGLDADCIVRNDYLKALWNFYESSSSNGASIHYEHPLHGPDRPEVYRAITEYELHLRYYVHARRWAGEKYAWQTVGSAMAVRSETYLAAGGMNTRKAGEDFYFLQKIMPHGFSRITDTVVIPSPRISDRVPFGTGKAMKELLSNARSLTTYAPESFRILRSFYHQKKYMFKGTPPKTDKRLAAYLESIDAERDIHRMRKISKDLDTFSKHFHGWFDGFRTMKALHFLRDNGIHDVPVDQASDWMLNLSGIKHHDSALNQLMCFRELDKT